MFSISRYAYALLLVCICSTVVCVILITYSYLLRDNTCKDITAKEIVYEHVPPEVIPITFPRRLNFTDEQIKQMSSLGKWLFLSEARVSRKVMDNKAEPYLILIWRHGPFLERRHIKRFSNTKFSPWENCSAKNCILSYAEKDIATADAVVIHLHLTKGVSELPQRQRPSQKWIFLTDESPMHTFMSGNQELSAYDGLFNWSMSYRSISDVPVPYGRTIPRPANLPIGTILEINNSIGKFKSKLLAIMGSNCVGVNGRWNYVKELKTILGNDLDIYGKCLNGNSTACPGHFSMDCPYLRAYKFYLAFENSNCKEYLTEKVFWHGYEKWAVPVIMGASKEDCDRLLPPRSFLHVSDFANPSALANYIQYLNRHSDKYAEYHEWRKYYTVINEHGYFGSASRHYCRICEALNYNSPAIKVYNNLKSFLNKEKDCTV